VRWLREPLWHFVVLGAAVFALHRAVTPADEVRRITVSANVRRALVAEHAAQYGAPPTAAQERAIVERWIDDEVRVREALVLGLDREDLIVRRRLIQKMDFLLEEDAPLKRATDAELNAWLAARPAAYAIPARVSLEHVCAASERHPADGETVVATWRNTLVQGGVAAGLGEPFLRGRTFARQTEAELAGIFGAPFAAAVMGMPTNTWSAPIRSSYGWHTVRLSERMAGGPAQLDDVRAVVERDWREAQRAVLDRAALERLRAQYEVVVEDGAP
jgi:peptidyl-prolyl cis-trans isomerase C